MEKLPQHIAIIMDGNRRWAKAKTIDPKLGHKEGAKNLENIARFANSIGLKYLTVYAFSTENWKRTEDEVGTLMKLLQHYLDDFSKRADTENIRINILGDIDVLDKAISDSIYKVMERTKNNTGLMLNVAFNYGGRAELIHAFKNISKDIIEKNIQIEEITEQLINENLYTKGIPEPDIMIRTSRELRTSGFLLWQMAYTEFIFVNKHWPDFNNQDLLNAIEECNKRKRNFGT